MKDNTLSHINRIAGQVKGIGRMMEKKSDSILVIGQIMAAKASLEQLAVKLIKNESKICSKKRIDRVVDILFKVK